MKQFLIAITVILMLAFVSNLRAGVYSWTDENGVRHYGNVGASEDAEDVEVKKETKTTTSKTKEQVSKRTNHQNKEHAGSLQSQMMNNPDTMSMINSLRSDPGFKEIEQDPVLMKALRDGDVMALMSNPKFLKFMNNSKVREITKKVQQDQKKK